MATTGGRAVLHIADYCGGYSGNFVASLRSLSAPCRELGLRIAIAFSESKVARPWLGALREDGIPVHLVPHEASLAARTRAIGRIAKSEGAALLHTHFATYDVPAAIAAVRAGWSVVWHMHSPMPGERPIASAAKQAVKLRVLGRYARAAAVSPAILDEAVRHGFPSARASCIPNGIDVAHATETHAGRDAFRRRLGIAPRDRVVLAFGWEPSRKGIDVVLDAAEALARRGEAPTLLLVGTEELQRFLAARFGDAIPDWVKATPPQEHVGDLYGAADAFVSASRVEGFPYALGEAFANGLPAVVSDIPGVEWARALSGARFFPSGDAETLAERLREVTGFSAAGRARHAAEARALAEGQLSLAPWAERVVALYRAALDAS